MKPRYLPIIMGIVLAVVAAVMINAYLLEQRQEVRRLRAGMEQQGVLVATQNIPAQTTLTAAMVDLTGVPEQYIQPYALREASSAVGKVTRAPIAKGEQVLEHKLAATVQVDAHSLAAVTPAGKRAVTVTLETVSAVGGLARPGDQVDILWTAVVVQPDKSTQAITLTLVRQALILAVNDQLLQPGRVAQAEPSASGTASTSRSGGRDTVPITFALSSEEMELVLFAKEQGKLQLAMRPTDDLTEDDTPPVSIEAVREALFGSSQQPAAAPPQRTVEVYRGLEKAVVNVQEEPSL